jgi:lipopolysaccharide export system protein LptA
LKNKGRSFYGFTSCFLWLFFGLGLVRVFAQQKDTAKRVDVIIKNTKDFQSFTTDTGNMQKFLGDVILQQGETTMYCDSAYLNQKTNNMEAFGHVRIVQSGGTEAGSDYMRYTGNQKLAFMLGNVVLKDSKGTLNSVELTYNTATKTGNYTRGGTLHNDSTTVVSDTGYYNSNNKDSRFTGHVHISHPSYKIESEDLEYNTESKLVTFYAPSVVISDKSILHTCCGTYDSKAEIANFPCHSNAWNNGQYLEGDTLYHNKVKGISYADGHVISIDTVQKATLYCGHADYNRRSGVLWATLKPVLKQINNKDSLFIRADTFYSAPIVKKQDSLSSQASSGKTTKAGSKKNKNPGPKNKLIEKSPVADTSAMIDSTAPRYYIGYHHVLIFSDSLQGVCDSISYTQNDSLMRMMYKPIAWSRKSQITGDTILLKTDSSRLKYIYVPNNACVVSLAGPLKANFYDQVQGKTLRGNFKDNTIKDLLVFPNAECIYYTKDEKGAYLGVDQGSADTLNVYFLNEQMDHIFFRRDVHHILTPLQKAKIDDMKLSRFSWLEALRPKRKEDLFK